MNAICCAGRRSRYCSPAASPFLPLPLHRVEQLRVPNKQADIAERIASTSQEQVVSLVHAFIRTYIRVREIRAPPLSLVFFGRKRAVSFRGERAVSLWSVSFVSGSPFTLVAPSVAPIAPPLAAARARLWYAVLRQPSGQSLCTSLSCMVVLVSRVSTNTCIRCLR